MPEGTNYCTSKIYSSNYYRSGNKTTQEMVFHLRQITKRTVKIVVFPSRSSSPSQGDGSASLSPGSSHPPSPPSTKQASAWAARRALPTTDCTSPARLERRTTGHCLGGGARWWMELGRRGSFYTDAGGGG
jgi:hypothetical protein